MSAPFSYQLPDGNLISITGGMPTTYPIDITRQAGFSEPITVSVSPLPSGVTYTVSPDNPALASEVLTVIFNSANNVPMATLQSSLSISDGQQPQTPSVLFATSPSVISSATSPAIPSPSPEPDELYANQTALIIGSGFGPATEVQFGTSGPEAAPSINSTGTEITVTVPANPAAGPITIIRPGGQSIVLTFSPNYTEGAITSMISPVTPVNVNSSTTIQAFAAGYSVTDPTGTQLTIFGFGFEPGDVVLFGPQVTPPPQPNQPVYDADDGNPNDENVPGQTILTTGPGGSPASTWQQVAMVFGTTPSYLSSSSIVVNVPTDAVSGPVYVVHPDGYVMTSPETLQVFSFRNSFAFSFNNGANNGFDGQNTMPNDWADFNVTEQDLADEFPGSTSFLNYITSNVQLGAWSSALNGNGSCFGLDVTASLLYQEFNTGMGIGNVAVLSPIPPTSGGPPPAINFSSLYAPTFSLLWDSFITMDGMTRSLVDTIQLNEISQMSVFATTTFLDQEAQYKAASGSSLVPDFMNRITSELGAGRPPIIGITPAGHAILAYDVEPDGAGGYYIYCYNPNDPIDTTATGTHPIYQSTDANYQQTQVAGYIVQTQAGMLLEDEQDCIHVEANGNWSWTQHDGEFYSGNLRGGGLQVFPVNISAVNHNTPFIGPAGTMSLPNPGNDVLLDGAILVIASVAPAAVGGATIVGISVVNVFAFFLDAPALAPVPAGIGSASASGPRLVPQADNAAARAAHSGKTWWVGSAPGSSFTSIQAAINSPSVQNGDTIKVEPGTFADASFANDTITVDKSLLIIGGQAFPGANQSGPSVVTSNSVGFTLEASNISIEQFTIHAAAATLGTAGIATAPGLSGSGYEISGNVLEDERYGLLMDTVAGKPIKARVARAVLDVPQGPAGRYRRLTAQARALVRTVRPPQLRKRSPATSSLVSGNSFQNNVNGIYSDAGASSILISSNEFTGDSGGSIALAPSSRTTNLQIVNNQITGDAAIILQNVSNSLVERNAISDPGGVNNDGIWLAGGVTRSLIAENSLVGNSGAGSGIDLSSAGNAGNTIYRNNATHFAKGIRLSGATGNTVLNNTLEENSAIGVDLASGAAHNMVQGNLAAQNFIGIAINAANSNTITDNNTSGNQNDGIAALASSGNLIELNKANRNGGAIGIVVLGSSNTISQNVANGNLLGIASFLSTNSTIERNTASGNQTEGIEVQYDVNSGGQKDHVIDNTAAANGSGGILLDMSSYVEVTDNHADSNAVFGIQVANSAEADTFDTIAKNTADGNHSGAGISLVNDSDTAVTRNTTKNNGVAGVVSQARIQTVK